LLQVGVPFKKRTYWDGPPTFLRADTGSPNSEREVATINFANSQVIGIDAGKNWFHVAVMNSRGQQTDRRKLRREALLEYVAQQERCLIAMEPCGGTQFLATKMQALGHGVRLVPAQFDCAVSQVK